MDTNIEQMRCGQCGTDAHKVFAPQQNQTITQTNVLYLECCHCKSVTEIGIMQPKITISNHSGRGTLANF